MLRLFKIEWDKLAHHKTTRVFTIIYFSILLSLIFLLTRSIDLSGGEENGLKLMFSKEGAITFPAVWHFVTFVAALAKIFLAVIIITLFTNEFTNRTLKQNLIDGLSKEEFLSSKLITIFTFTALSTLVVFGISLGLGLYYTEGEFEIFKEVEFIAYYFLKLTTFFSFCMFLAFLIRKSAFALLGFFVWWIGEAVISSAETMIRIFVFKQESTQAGVEALSNYLPLNCMSNLIKWPLLRLKSVQFMTQGQIPYDPQTDLKYVIACIIYTGLFIFLSYRILKKRDL